MSEEWRRLLWSYRAAQTSPARMARALEQEIQRIETCYHQRLEPEEDLLARSVPALIEGFQAATRHALERLSHSAYFAAGMQLEGARRRLRELDRVVAIHHYHGEVSAHCSELREGLGHDRLRQLRTGRLLRRLPRSGRQLLERGDYLAARFTIRACEQFARRLQTRDHDDREGRTLRMRINALAAGCPATGVVEILHRFRSENRLYLAAQLVGDLEAVIARRCRAEDLKPLLRKLSITNDRARRLSREIEESFPLKQTNDSEEALEHGQSQS